jgi:hypothetical protein
LTLFLAIADCKFAIEEYYFLIADCKIAIEEYFLNRFNVSINYVVDLNMDLKYHLNLCIYELILLSINVQVVFLPNTDDTYALTVALAFKIDELRHCLYLMFKFI